MKPVIKFEDTHPEFKAPNPNGGIYQMTIQQTGSYQIGNETVPFEKGDVIEINQDEMTWKKILT